MSKRFHDTEIWNEDWFLDMDEKYRLFWFFIKDTCDHAGIWKPNIRRFNNTLEDKIDIDEALHVFNGDKLRVDVLPNNHWVLLDFIQFQYGKVLNLNNRVHLSVFNRLKDLGVNLGSIRGLVEVKMGSIRGQVDLKAGVKEKEKEKDLISNISSNGNIVLDSSNINNYEEILKVVDSFYTIMINQFPKKYKGFEKKKDVMYHDGIEIIDKLMRLDGYSMEDVTLALKFWIKDDFYSGSMRSISGLRRKSDNGSTKFENLFHKCISQDKKTNMESFINA